jgi:hypothetical protein
MISAIFARLFENNDMTKLTNCEVRGCVTDTFHKTWRVIISVRAPKILLGHLSRESDRGFQGWQCTYQSFGLAETL